MVNSVAAKLLHLILQDLETEERKVYSTIVMTNPGLSLSLSQSEYKKERENFQFF